MISIIIIHLNIDSPICHLHQINGAENEAEIVGNTVTVMFEGTGPSPTNLASEYRVLFEQEVGGSYMVLQDVECSDLPLPNLQFPVTCDIGVIGEEL